MISALMNICLNWANTNLVLGVNKPEPKPGFTNNLELNTFVLGCI